MRRLALVLLPLVSLASARAQRCADTLRPVGSPQPGQTVSLRLLQISAGAKQHYDKAVAAAAHHHFDVSEREAAIALSDAPRFAEVDLLRAANQLHAGHAAEALDLITAARTIEPDLPWATIVAAGALNSLNRFRDAVRELQNARDPEAASWQAIFERARAEIGQTNIVSALHWSELAVAAAPVGCTEAHLLRANALHLAGRPGEVVTELESFLAEDRVRTRREQVLAALDRARAALQTDTGRGLVAMKE